eukprot:6468894-Prymnesium_polylepis.1
MPAEAAAAAARVEGWRATTASVGAAVAACAARAWDGAHLHHLLLERALHVRLEEGARDGKEELLVRRAARRVEGRLALLEQLARVEAVDELRVQAPLRHREERVEERPAALPQVDRQPAVLLRDLTLREPARAVHRSAHVAEAVDFEQVAGELVDDEPARHELRVEAQPGDGEALGAQQLLGVVVGALLPQLHLVVDQRVVHVVADHLDEVHVDRARAEDAARRRLLLRAAPESTCRIVEWQPRENVLRVSVAKARRRLLQQPLVRGEVRAGRLQHGAGAAALELLIRLDLAGDNFHRARSRVRRKPICAGLYPHAHRRRPPYRVHGRAAQQRGARGSSKGDK